MSTCEELCYELLVFKGALGEDDVIKGFKLLSNGRCLLADMGSDLIAIRLSISPFFCLGRATEMEGMGVYPTADATRAREAACRPVALTITSVLFVM